MGDLFMLFFSNPIYIAFCIIVGIIAAILAIICFKDGDVLAGVSILFIALFIIVAIPLIWWLFVAIVVIVILMYCIHFLGDD